MAESCSIIPRVFNDKGEKVDSKLFKDLLSYFPNRDDASRVYLATKNSVFKDEMYSKLELDEYGEPTVKSLLDKTNLSKYISDEQILKKLNKDIGYYKKGMERPALWIDNDENYRKLLDRARDFNNNSSFRDDYVANVIKLQDPETYRIAIGVKVERRNKFNSLNADKEDYNEKLNSKLKDILASSGVSIGALTELEKRMGINGVTDFDRAKASSQGIIELIRLAEGIKGEKALPEEFAHFALEAIGDNPLVNRLINNIITNNLSKEIIGEDYDSYVIAYRGDEYKLAKEAAGKLLAKHLLNNESIPSKSYKNLLSRLIEYIKNFLKRINISSIQGAIDTSNKEFGRLANEILNGELGKSLNINNIKSSGSLYNVESRVTRDRSLLQKIIDNEVKRLKIYDKRSTSTTFDTKQRLLIDKLETSYETNKEIEGIYDFIDNAINSLKGLTIRLNSINDSKVDAINKKAEILRDVRNYLFSYKGIIKEIREALMNEEEYTDNRYGDRMRPLLDSMSPLMDDLYIKYNKVAMPLFVDFIRPFVGDGIEIPFGKYKGKIYTAENLVKMAENDISFFDRWLDSMADSSDYILKIMDQLVKTQREDARLNTINDQKDLQAAAIKLEQSGIKDFEWMFEKDNEGHKTGNYISDLNMGMYHKNKKEFFKYLTDKYGRNPIGQDATECNKEISNWYETNTAIIDGIRTPLRSIYENSNFKNLTSSQKEFYDKVLEIKSRLDSYLPEGYTTLNSAVKIRKDLLERIKSAGNTKEALKEVWENVKDGYIRRTDDTDFGDRSTIIDFEGNEVQTLPIYFTKMKEGEKADDLSTDVISTMTAYASMANDFNEMNKIIHTLELGRDVLKNREITQTRGDKPLMERFREAGKNIENTLTMSGDKSNFIQKLNDFFTMQVYGRYMADEGSWGNVDKAKAANNLSRLTSINTMALNLLSGISNVATGTIMMRIESLSGEFYNETNTLHADRNYAKAMPEFLSQVGERIKTSKLALWDEKFNVLQEYEREIRETDFDKKTWFSRMFNTSALFIPTHAGEHWMQNRTSLALADAYKMRSPEGKITNLWDSMEVVYIDPNNKSLGAKLELKKGYTKEDGSAFTHKDIVAFSRKSAAINQRMHGIYNKADKSAIHRVAIGRLGMAFREWVKASLNRRFKSVGYNMDLQAWTEGYYRTAGRFMWQLTKELKRGQFSIASDWNNLTDTEKANMKRAIVEVGHYMLILASLAIIDWDKDKDRPWALRMLEYQMRRLQNEIGVMVPGKPMIDEGLRILKSPAAAIQTIQSTLNLMNLINPFNYEFFNGNDAILQSGPFKGHTRAFKYLMKSPLAPMRNTIVRGINPELAIPFFKQNYY